MTALTRWGKPLVLALTALLLPAPTHAAAPSTCTGDPVAVVHDFANTGSAARALQADLEAAGRCVAVLEHGRGNGVLVLLGSLGPGGMAPLDQSAATLAVDLAALAATSPTGRVDVVGHGAGSLAVTRALQTGLDPRLVGTFVAVGALWDGTTLLGLADLEQLSRDAGTYATVLQLEELLLDPLCASCRELIAGSDFLRTLHAEGLVPAGPRVVTINSRTDALVQPAASGELPGAENRWIQDVAPGRLVLHPGMLRDAVVRQMVLEALV